MIHPHTFMFIKTFEDVRKYLIQHTHIELLVDYGLDRVNLFGPGILLDATWYVISKKTKEDQIGTYFNITQNQQEKFKQSSLEQAYDDLLNGRKNERIFLLPQEKLKIIEGYPFIYWFSNSFREKFKEKSISNYLRICKGLTTADNERFLRYHWEIDREDISEFYSLDNKRWVPFAKGGPYNKWYGNLWLLVDWDNEGFGIKNNLDSKGNLRSVIRNSEYYFKHGLTSSLSSSKGITFRELPQNHITEGACAGAFLINDNLSIYYFLGLLNSNLVTFIAAALNSSVTTEVGDIQRIPFQKPDIEVEKIIETCVKDNIEIKKRLCSFRLIETNFKKSPLIAFGDNSLKDRILSYLNFENSELSKVLLNEAVIDKQIFNVYGMNPEDRLQVDIKMGKSVGDLPVLNEARKEFISTIKIENELIKSHIQNLPAVEYDEQTIRELKSEFINLYQSNNNFEDFCSRVQLNPITAWYLFKEFQTLPQHKAQEISLEFLIDAVRNLLMDDDDGIIPLVGLPGEARLSDRLEQYFLNDGLTSAQFMQLDNLIGRPINEYLEQHFFKNLSDHLNLFMHLPKTPFIWHLSSGLHKGFETYIVIYKWNKDSLFKLKSHYLSKRKESLEFREIQLQGSETAQSQSEKELIRHQLNEIEEFTKKIDELIEVGYNPTLAGGVAKNIAPLQKKGMLKADVLKKPQLDKYLKANW